MIATKFHSQLARPQKHGYRSGNEVVRRMESGENPEQFALL
jgi:hypothetical protein